MANYIWSNANRFYVARETNYGIPAAVTPSNRFPAVRLQCHQNVPISKRRDKTGSRTYSGSVPGATRVSAFEVSTYLTSWDQAAGEYYAPFVQSAMGSAPETVQGLIVATANGAQVQTQAPHDLSTGSAVSNGGEVRFVVTVPDSLTVDLCGPFTITPGAGTMLSLTNGYRLGTQLPSISIYDYWDPLNGVSRLITGAGVDRFEVSIKGDLHELRFSGPAADVIDSCSALFGLSNLGSFPQEPPQSELSYSIVPGQLGQVWLGSPLNQVFALTEASVEIKNNLRVRNEEYGSSFPRAIVAGPREVITSFTLFAQADADTRSLYAAAKTRTTISALLQLGQQAGQMMAVYLPNVVPELPLFEDSEPYLLWQFKNSLAQGVANDEAYVAFA